jgi:hypothetical protein
MRFFVLNWFGQKNPSELLINHLKYFRFCLRIRRDIQIFVHSAYYQNMEIFLPRIIRIRKFLFRVLSVYVQFHSAYYLLTLSFSWNGKYIVRILSISKISFLVFSLYAKFHSPYSLYEFNFFPRIIGKRTMSFNVLSANAKFFWDQSLIPRIISLRLISFRILTRVSHICFF